MTNQYPRKRCLGADAKIGPGAETQIVTWSAEPQPDWTLRGSQNDTAMSDECGNRGYVYRTPLLVTRTGDVPAAAVLADPALFELPPAPPSTSPHP